MLAVLIAQQTIPIPGKSYTIPLLPFMVIGVYLVLRARKRKQLRQRFKRKAQRKKSS